jgi:hypothetical protein
VQKAPKNVAQPVLGQNSCITFSAAKRSQKFRATSVIKKNCPK